MKVYSRGIQYISGVSKTTPTHLFSVNTKSDKMTVQSILSDMLLSVPFKQLNWLLPGKVLEFRPLWGIVVLDGHC